MVKKTKLELWIIIQIDAFFDKWDSILDWLIKKTRKPEKKYTEKMFFEAMDDFGHLGTGIKPRLKEHIKQYLKYNE
jgi:hypothetical protein